jgi:predicted ArsR family transcriptional regulator
MQDIEWSEREANRQLVAVCLRTAFVAKARPVTVAEVIKMVDGRLSRATVYRHLAEMASEGWVIQYGRMKELEKGRGRPAMTYMPRFQACLTVGAEETWRAWYRYGFMG